MNLCDFNRPCPCQIKQQHNRAILRGQQLKQWLVMGLQLAIALDLSAEELKSCSAAGDHSYYGGHRRNGGIVGPGNHQAGNAIVCAEQVKVVIQRIRHHIGLCRLVDMLTQDQLATGVFLQHFDDGL